MALVPTILSLIGLGGLIATAVWLLVRGNNNRITRLFLICQSSVIIWLISQLMKLFSANTEQFWISYVIGNIGICSFAPLWLMFAAEYSDYRQHLRKPCSFLPSVSVIFFLCVITNPLHHNYYKTFEFRNVVCGRIYYLSQIVYYVLIFAGICLMFIKHSRSRRRMTSQSLLLAAAIVIPLCINTLSVAGIIKTEIELAPLFFSFSVILVLIAIGRYGLLDVNRIAINDTVDSIDSAIIVFDADDRITYMNKRAQQLITLDKDASLDEFIAAIKEISGTELDRNDLSCELSIGEEHFNIRQNFCMNKKGVSIASIIIMSNVSEYYELLSAEKRLSLEQERNRIAQEIHDSAGHTFTMISSLSRIINADLSGRDVPAETTGYVREIDGLSRSGITQLRCSINNLRDDEFMSSVTRAVNTVAEAVREVKIDVCTQGEEDESFAFCIRTVYENTRETITNAMRYSGADRIDIIVKFRSDMLELYIFDNGRGCPSISENNGLRGIRSRTEALGGTVKFSSVEGEGFSTIIRIPKQ